MQNRKLEFIQELNPTLNYEKNTFIKLLNSLPSTNGNSKILFEETMHFYGLWETSLHFYNRKNKKIDYFENIIDIEKKIINEFNDDESYKTYSFITYNKKKYLPLFSFFFFDKKKQNYQTNIIFDTTNEELPLKMVISQLDFQNLDTDIEIIKKITNINQFNSKPFLFLKNN